MSSAAHAVLLSILILAAAVWVGGFIAIVVVARTSSIALEPAQRVSLFRALGRAYLKVGVTALILAYVTGAALLWPRDWDGVQIATVAVAIALLIVLGVAVRQARQMTRLRSRALKTTLPAETAAPEPERPGEAGAALAEQIRRRGQSVTALRGAIGVLSIALIVLGAVLAG